MVTKIKYGKRSAYKGLRPGARPVATTFGRTSNPVAAAKFADRQPFLADGPAEQLVAQMLDLDPEVVSFLPQGVAVDLVAGCLLYTREQRSAAAAKYKSLPGPCIYTGDYLVELSGARQRVLEVKLDSFPGDEVYQEKFQRAKLVLNRYGCELAKVIIPADERRPVWTTVPLVTQAFMHRALWPSAEVLEKIGVIAEAGASTARDYLRPLGLEVNMLPVLVASGALSTDLLSLPLQGGSPVEAAYGDLSHLQLIDRLQP